jgi:hypothetical protein
MNLLGTVVVAAVMGASPVAEASPHVHTVTGTQDALPQGYVPPMLSNGNLCMLVDFQGGQTQQMYAKMMPCIYWAGRRYGPPNDQLVPFGHFSQELSYAGQIGKGPTRWSQTLDTRRAVTTCRSEYADGVTVESTVFVPLGLDVVAIRKRVSAKTPKTGPTQLALKYVFAPPGKDRLPRRTVAKGAWNAGTSSADIAYQIDGHRMCGGVIAVVCDRPAKATSDGPAVRLATDLALDPARPAEVTFYLMFADSIDGKDYRQRIERLKSRVKTQGFDGLLAEHCRQWSEYWGESEIHIPEDRIERAYYTAQYHLRGNATRWSFPVGIFTSHWAGRYFGWDEMFCYLGLASSNHLAVARRVPDFRLACLPQALARTSRYFNNSESFGARYPWETLEDGSEAAPAGYWHDHVFHMSNIAQCSWFQYLYNGDREYLKTTGYPVIRECATFFLKQMVYEDSDGSMFFGRCCDLERLGPARQNPFMTSCGAIFTMEAAAQAARLLGVDEDLAQRFTHAATKLRASLPHNGEQYVPYAGCPERSIAVLGGVFPYPVLDPHSRLQKNAIYDFVKNCGAFGNMYPVGKSVSGWYAGWMASALAALGDRSEPINRLSQAAQDTGCFGEIFEINEKEVVMHPWFSTAAGNYVYALNQVLVQSQGDEIRIAPAVPESWKKFSFRLPCYGNLMASVAVDGGRVVDLTLIPGNPEKLQKVQLLIPSRLIDRAQLNPQVATVGADAADNTRLVVSVRGRTTLLKK